MHLNLVTSVPYAVTLTFLVSYWRCDMKIRPGNATPNIVWIVYCVPGFWLFWWRWYWGEKEKKVEQLSTCPRGCWGWSVPDLDIGPWICDGSGIRTRGQLSRGSKQPTLERASQETRVSPLRWRLSSVLLRHSPGLDVPPGALSKHNMPGITVAPVRSSLVTSVACSR